MTNILKIADGIIRAGADMRGVFSLSDLQNLLGAPDKSAFYRQLNRLQEAGIINRFARGFYVTSEFDPAALSQRICPESYISFGTILAENLLIGSVPSHQVTAVKTGASRVYDSGKLRIEQLQVTPSVFFGYRAVDGVNRALPEKAVLDTLYFYKRGKPFSFDVYSDIDYEGLDKKRIMEFLGRYRNPVFRQFARRLING